MSTTPTFKILYVCDGNNARSPLAAQLTAGLVSGDETGLRWEVDSAGTEATEGDPIRAEVQRAASVANIDLSGHRARRLDPPECLAPDLVLAMAWDQVTQLWSLVPEAWDKVFTIKEFIHWAKRAPVRPPILFADRAAHMRDRVMQAHAVRKRARADHGFWGGLRPQDLNVIEPTGYGDEAWAALTEALGALVSDVVTLLVADGVRA
jgi:protein-tyrosine-phosphatase